MNTEVFLRDLSELEGLIEDERKKRGEMDKIHAKQIGMLKALFEKEKKEMLGEIAKMRGENEELCALLLQQDKDNEELKKKLHECEDSVEVLTLQQVLAEEGAKEANSLKQTVKLFEAEITALKDKNAYTQVCVAEKEKEIALLKENIAEMKGRSAVATTGLQARITELEGQLHKAKQEHERQMNRLRTEYEERIRQREAAVENEVKVSQRLSEMSELKIKGLQQEVDKLTEVNKRLQERLDKAEKSPPPRKEAPPPAKKHKPVTAAVTKEKAKSVSNNPFDFFNSLLGDS